MKSQLNPNLKIRNLQKDKRTISSKALKISLAYVNSFRLCRTARGISETSEGRGGKVESLSAKGKFFIFFFFHIFRLIIRLRLTRYYLYIVD